MTHYYFHLFNDEVTHDDEGTEIEGIDAARTFAIDAARALAAESIVEYGHLVLSHRIEIQAEGQIVDTVHFRDAIQIED